MPRDTLFPRRFPSNPVGHPMGIQDGTIIVFSHGNSVHTQYESNDLWDIPWDFRWNILWARIVHPAFLSHDISHRSSMRHPMSARKYHEKPHRGCHEILCVFPDPMGHPMGRPTEPYSSHGRSRVTSYGESHWIPWDEYGTERLLMGLAVGSHGPSH